MLKKNPTRFCPQFESREERCGRGAGIRWGAQGFHNSTAGHRQPSGSQTDAEPCRLLLHYGVGFLEAQMLLSVGRPNYGSVGSFPSIKFEFFDVFIGLIDIKITY